MDSDAAGRAYAAYGGVYIIASLAWLWMVEGVRPDRWDLTGAVICLELRSSCLARELPRLMPRPEYISFNVR